MKNEKILASRSWADKSASIKVNFLTNKVFIQGLSYKLGHWDIGPRTEELATIPEDILKEALNKCMTSRLKSFYQKIWEKATAQNPWFNY